MITKINVKDVRVGKRFRSDVGDLAELKESISTLGMLHPIVLDPEHNLIAGFRRLESAKALNWSEVDCRIVSNLDDATLQLTAERDENSCRKDFTKSEAVALGKRLEELERPKAKARVRAAQNNRSSENFTEQVETPKGDTRDKVGQAVGMSGVTYQRAKAVVEAAESDPKTFESIKNEMDKTGKVNPAYDKVREIKSVNSSPTARRAPSPVSTKRAIETIGYAVDALEQINVDLLKGRDRIDAVENLKEVRSRISKLINLMRG